MSVNEKEFRSALSRFASGVTVVTGRDASGEAFGMTVSSFCSVSLDPPLVLVCIQKKIQCHAAIAETDSFAVNVLAENQDAISNTFASHSSDKFSSVRFKDGIGGSPLIEDAIANIECTKFSEFDGGDHTVFIGRVEKITVGEGAPLVYWGGSYRKLEAQ